MLISVIIYEVNKKWLYEVLQTAKNAEGGLDWWQQLIIGFIKLNCNLIGVRHKIVSSTGNYFSFERL